MKHLLELEILPQPDDSSCGQTCLAAVYHYWNDPVVLPQLISEIGRLGGGGTLAVHLACHALKRGYEAEITTYNLQLFDPSWFELDGTGLSPRIEEKLRHQFAAKSCRPDVDRHRLEVATESYLQFLSLGGRLQMRPLDQDLIVRTLNLGVPMLCGLSATYLYHECRERPQPVDDLGRTSVPDDVAGDPSGHFVVLHGYDHQTGKVLIADPLHPNPIAPTSKYAAPLVQLTSAILLGIVTFDANLLTLKPRTPQEEKP